jgi:hypothetical protein
MGGRDLHHLAVVDQQPVRSELKLVEINPESGRQVCLLVQIDRQRPIACPGKEPQ